MAIAYVRLAPGHLPPRPAPTCLVSSFYVSYSPFLVLLPCKFLQVQKEEKAGLRKKVVELQCFLSCNLLQCSKVKGASYLVSKPRFCPGSARPPTKPLLGRLRRRRGMPPLHQWSLRNAVSTSSKYRKDVMLEVWVTYQLSSRPVQLWRDHQLLRHLCNTHGPIQLQE